MKWCPGSLVFVLTAFVGSIPALGQAIDFGRDVRPILSDRCFHCHGPDAENQDSDFRLDSHDNMTADLGGYAGVVPGDLDSSELVARIRSTDESDMMPPPDSNRSLSDAERSILEAWIEQGAPYEGHWAFELPQRPDVPTDIVSNSKFTPETIERWSANPIDAFIARRLIEKKLSPSPPSDPATLLRRASLTLTGLLPPQDLQARFLSNPTDEAYRRAVDELLGSMDYAERQTLRWLDAARYADTDGYQNDAERTNWPWRDWVIQAFDNNMPFDQFTIEQLAGDMLPEATESQRLATAFNRNHRQNNEGGALAEEFLVENTIDRVETTSTVWLGLTMGCCRCHDHKYDPIAQREFFQFYAYFNNIGEKGIGKGIHSNPVLRTKTPLVQVAPALYVALGVAEQKRNEARRGLDERVKAWAAPYQESLAEDPEAALENVPQNIAKFLARPFTEWNDNNWKAIRQHVEKTDELVQAAQKQVNAANRKLRDAGGELVNVMIMNERSGDPTPAYLLDRGQYDAPVMDDPLPRGVPKSLLNLSESQSPDAMQPTDRLALARWMVSDQNPLTARVIVNRIWQEHFGIGLVKTVDDFGLQGEAPSHPELLDYLATRFIDSGWDVKAMHRLMVTSATYRQSSRHRRGLTDTDPENRLLARGPRYRGDGFMLRDIAMQASGLLNKSVGGPPVKPYQPAGLWETVAADAGTRYQPDQGGKLYRKSMYTYWKRAVNPPRQIIFDAGGREICNVRAPRTNTPLQALVLMNDPTFVEAARKLAERTLLVDMDNVEAESARLGWLYETATSKPASARTLAVLNENLAWFQKHYAENPDAAEQLLSTGKSETNKSLDTQALAAMAAVAHLVMNTDQFVSVE